MIWYKVSFSIFIDLSVKQTSSTATWHLINQCLTHWMYRMMVLVFVQISGVVLILFYPLTLVQTNQIVLGWFVKVMYSTWLNMYHYKINYECMYVCMYNKLHTHSKINYISWLENVYLFLLTELKGYRFVVKLQHPPVNRAQVHLALPSGYIRFLYIFL